MPFPSIPLKLPPEVTAEDNDGQSPFVVIS